MTHHQRDLRFIWLYTLLFFGMSFVAVHFEFMNLSGNVGIFLPPFLMLMAVRKRWRMHVAALGLLITHVLFLGGFFYRYGAIELPIYVALRETNWHEALGYLNSISWHENVLPVAMLVVLLLWYRLGLRYAQEVQHPPYTAMQVASRLSENGEAGRPRWVRFTVWALCNIFFWVCLTQNLAAVQLWQLKAVTQEYHETIEQVRAAVQEKDSWTYSHTPQWGRYKNYIVVIGESARADYLSAFGYPYDTTPYLNTAPGIFFQNAYSMGPNTNSSLSRTFARVNEHGDPMDRRNNFMTLANRVGMKTFWISNQARLGRYAIGYYYASIKAQSFYFVGEKHNGHSGDDAEMLPALQEVLKTPTEGSRLIVLHMYGSHPYPCDRLNAQDPVPFHYAEGRVVDCYVATIRKLDTFIHDLVKVMNQSGQSYSAIYFSDHGLEVDGKAVRHAVLYNSYHVPFFMLGSDLHAHINEEAFYSQRHFLSLFAQWIGVTTPLTNPAYDPYDLAHFPNDQDQLKVFVWSDALVSPFTLQKNPALMPVGAEPMRVPTPGTKRQEPLK